MAVKDLKGFKTVYNIHVLLFEETNLQLKSSVDNHVFFKFESGSQLAPPPPKKISLAVSMKKKSVAVL
jgi:hypothetical protein